MGNVFVSLPVPAFDGVGAAVDTSTMGDVRTVVVAGAFDASISVEGSCDGVNFYGVGFFTGQDYLILHGTFMQMRVRVLSFRSGLAICAVGAGALASLCEPMAVPPSNGSGAPLDVSGYGPSKTVFVFGAGFTGYTAIEVSEDGVGFVAVGGASTPQVLLINAHALSMRVTRSGVVVDPLLGPIGPVPLVLVGAITADAASGGGIGGLDIDLFVDSSTGSDTNPGTQTLPLETLEEAFRRLPATWQKSAEIHSATGTYTLEDEIFVGTPNGPDASRLRIVGDTPTNVLGDQAAGLGSTDTVIQGVFVPSAHFGQWVLILTGASAGERRMIADNTATDLPVNAPFSVPIAAGDSYRIEVPSVVIDCGVPGGDLAVLTLQTGIEIQDLKFVMQPTAVGLGLIIDGDVSHQGCEFDLTAGLFVVAGSFSAGSQAGSYIHDGALFWANGGGGGALMFQNLLCLLLDQVSVELGTDSSLFAKTSNIVIEADSIFDHAAGGGPVRGKMDGDLAIPVPPLGGGPPFLPVLTFKDNSSSHEGGINNLEISNFNGYAVGVIERSYARILDLTGSSAVPGSVALLVFWLSQMSIERTTLLTAVTGAAGDLQVGTGAPVAYAVIDADPSEGITELRGGVGAANVTLCRIERV